MSIHDNNVWVRIGDEVLPVTTIFVEDETVLVWRWPGWAMKRFTHVLNKQGAWEYEPNPSSRSDEFIDRTRFDTPEEALEAYRKLEE